MDCMFGLFLYTVFAALSWAFVVGMSAIICTYFGFVWSVKIATGVWLVLFVLSTVFGGSKK